MPGTLHAAILIGISVGAVISLLALKRRVPTSGQFVLALAVAAVGTLAAPYVNHHLCREGEPRTQWLILGPCLLLILLFVASALWRRVLGGVVWVGMMGLSCHFTALVHEPGWTGNPTWDGGASSALRSARQRAAIAVSSGEDKDVVMPQGWLRDLPIWTRAGDMLGDRRPVRRELKPRWHTWITGLYRYSSIPQDFWYPGGSLADAVDRIELRDRPTE